MGVVNRFENLDIDPDYDMFSGHNFDLGHNDRKILANTTLLMNII